jgi:hypothetical protein
MVRVIDQDTGKPYNLDITPELRRDIDAFLASECNHTNSEIRKRKISNGVHFYCQCTECGNAIGAALKRSAEMDSSPPWDTTLQDKHREKRDAIRTDFYQKHVRKQKAGDDGFRREYDRYLESPEWEKKRAAILKRANYVCEGCLENQATQVHHLTYNHIFNEFMFELVAICSDCHRRIHKDEGADDSETEIYQIDWSVVHPCDGCRYTSEEKGQWWCFILDQSTIDALAETGDCGPNRHNFESLR